MAAIGYVRGNVNISSIILLLENGGTDDYITLYICFADSLTKK